MPREKKKKTKQKKKTDEHLALSVLDLSDSLCWLNIEQIVLHELMGKLICGQHGAAATTKGIVDGQAILLNELFSSCGFLPFSLPKSRRLHQKRVEQSEEKSWRWFLINFDRVRRHNGIQSSHCIRLFKTAISSSFLHSFLRLDFLFWLWACCSSLACNLGLWWQTTANRSSMTWLNRSIRPSRNPQWPSDNHRKSFLPVFFFCFVFYFTYSGDSTF